MGTPNEIDLNKHEEELHNRCKGGPTIEDVKNYAIENIPRRYQDEFIKRVFSTI